MALSLTCSCGALLEIDDKFAGKIINCPDCNRPLNTAPPVPEPPLTSGFALASLLSFCCSNYVPNGDFQDALIAFGFVAATAFVVLVGWSGTLVLKSE